MDVADEMNFIFGDKVLSARHYFNDRTRHLHSQATFLNHHNFIAVMEAEASREQLRVVSVGSSSRTLPSQGAAIPITTPTTNTTATGEHGEEGSGGEDALSPSPTAGGDRPTASSLAVPSRSCKPASTLAVCESESICGQCNEGGFTTVLFGGRSGERTTISGDKRGERDGEYTTSVPGCPGVVGAVGSSPSSRASMVADLPGPHEQTMVAEISRTASGHAIAENGFLACTLPTTSITTSLTAHDHGTRRASATTSLRRPCLLYTSPLPRA